MVACWAVAVVWIGLIATADAPKPGEAGGNVAVVVVDRLDVFDEPDESAYVSTELVRGTRVVVVSGHRRDWLTIEPPNDAFDWVDAAAVRTEADGIVRVVADRAAVRSGAAEAMMPGAPRPPLSKGTVVRLLDRPDLKVGEGPRSRTWRAIEPPSGEVRYIRPAGVKLEAGPEPVAERQASMPTREEPAPAEIALELTPIDELRRSILLQPVEQWDLEPARQQYEALLRRLGNIPAASVVRNRLDRVAKEAEVGKAARRFDELVRSSRRRDAEIAQIRVTLADARTDTDRGYDARGLLQASSRRVNGQRVHALIGPEGLPVAYLSIPPGLPANELLARKVGVRGPVHYNESLGARLITVRDLDPLDPPRRVARDEPDSP